ncbi:hypothetical protein GCM10022214_27150 [Actinomadura miaoliensis]|uniref:Uncharacterized protein n=1 Tax=Actinomadura miaoliensis TaxID=430685 RepID=A0ABP7VM06_9ACTN
MAGVRGVAQLEVGFGVGVEAVPPGQAGSAEVSDFTCETTPNPVPAPRQPRRHPHCHRRPAPRPHRRLAERPGGPATLDMPGKVADFLRTVDLDAAERAALDHGQTVRRGQGYTLRITATPAVHRQLLDHCWPLDGTAATPHPTQSPSRVRNPRQHPRPER